MKYTIVNYVKRLIENYILQIQIRYLECLISANIRKYRSYSYLFKICKIVFGCRKFSVQYMYFRRMSCIYVFKDAKMHVREITYISRFSSSGNLFFL